MSEGRSVRVLCLDHEGGHGGASRSLFESIRHLDRRRFEIEVWCRRPSHLVDEYASMGVTCEVRPEMPTYNARRGFANNVVALGRAVIGLVRANALRRDLEQAARSRFDVVHFNHEGLFILAWWLRRRSSIPLAMHVRTRPAASVFARFEARVITATTDRLVFITENELAHLSALAGLDPRGTVVYNIATPSDGDTPLQLRQDQPASLMVASLSNYSWWRGTDRLIEVAESLVGRGRRDIRFVVAGDQRVSGPLPGPLGVIARSDGKLEEYAEAQGVADLFHFVGHVSHPQRVLVTCDVLLKPTRESNPWGRDIIEALVNGLPVLAVGTWQRFVEHDVTGYLQREFDADEMAEWLMVLADDPEIRRRLGVAARERAMDLFDPLARAAQLADVWTSMTGARSHR